MRKILFKRGKVAAAFITVFFVTTLVTSFMPMSTATMTQTATATPTINIAPNNGTVGTEVQVNGTIDTPNGPYTVRWNGTLNVTTGYATGINVTTSFFIPPTVGAPSPGREVLVELIDDNQTVDNIVNTTFRLYTEYHIKAVAPPPPSQLQEGQTTDILVNVTGGEANTRYWANITVTDPSGWVYYNDTLRLTNTTNTGTGEGSITYPADFSLGANTNYVGTYNITFNGTLATGNFTVGLTDKLECRRAQTVYVQGAGYNAYENVTVDITLAASSVAAYPKNVTADSNGVVNDSWTIPLDAAVGTYEVALVNATTSKLIPDHQNFTIVETIIPISIDPTEGKWGTEVRVVGEIVTLNGSYQIRWDGERIKDGTCAVDSVKVNDTFSVPPSSRGVHNVTLYDVAQQIESTPSTFNVTASSCYVSAKPTRIQEGLNANITVGVNEAEADKTLAFTINVTDPQPIPASYTATLIVSTEATGSGSNSTLYYGNFSSGANTNYVGAYTVAILGFKETLTIGSFTVGLTDKPEYRRKYTVLIQGSGYNATANENVTINIITAGESVEGYPKNKTAEDGVVTDSWLILEDAKPGTYTVTLTNATAPGTDKKPKDIQNFTVLGAVCLIQAWNVAVPSEPLANVTIVARNVTTNAVLDVRDTNETGWAEFPVDLDNYTFEAEFEVEGNVVIVGSLRNQSFTEIEKTYRLNLTFWIAHMKITIQDEANHPLPFIDVTLNYSYTTQDGQTIPRTYTFVTNTTGTRTFPDMLANISYTIEARLYGYRFNRTEIENLIATRWINIICPTYTMFVHVLDSKGLPLQNVEVEAYEWSSGVAQPVQSNTTNSWGSATFQITFGKYKIWVYSQNRTVILNKTVADLIEDRLFIIVHCKISNVDLSVVVKDYLGNPIPNALVKVEREGVDIPGQKTGSKGIASFYDITGGDSRISVSVMGKLCETRTLYLDGTGVVVFKLEKYTVVGGYPLETTQLITGISLGILVASLVLALIYRRLRPRKVSEEKEKSL